MLIDLPEELDKKARYLDPKQGWVEFEHGNSFSVGGGNHAVVNDEKKEVKRHVNIGIYLLLFFALLIASGIWYSTIDKHQTCYHIMAQAGTPEAKWDKCEEQP